jgi:hypothetical protein
MLALTNVAEPDWPGRQSRGQARRRNARRPSPFRKDVMADREEARRDAERVELGGRRLDFRILKLDT